MLLASWTLYDATAEASKSSDGALCSACDSPSYALDQLSTSPSSRLNTCLLHDHVFSLKVPINLNTVSPYPPSMIPKILLLIKQIRPRTPQIDNLRTSIAVLLQPRALKTVERIRDAFPAAHDAYVLVVAEGAFVADAREGGWAHVGVAHRAFTVAFIAEASDGDAGLFATHNKISGRCVSGVGFEKLRGAGLTDDGETFWIS